MRAKGVPHLVELLRRVGHRCVRVIAHLERLRVVLGCTERVADAPFECQLTVRWLARVLDY